MMDYKEMISKFRSEADCIRKHNMIGWADGYDLAATAIEILLAERDALYKFVKRRFWLNPEECSHYGDCYKKAYDDMRMLGCPSCKNWQWRGPQKGDTQ